LIEEPYLLLKEVLRLTLRMLLFKNC